MGHIQAISDTKNQGQNQQPQNNPVRSGNLTGGNLGCLQSLYFTVYGNMAAFISPGCTVTLPVVLFMCTHYSPVFCTVVLVGAGILIYLGSRIVMTWLAMIFCPFSNLDLTLYLCTSVTLQVLPQFGWVSGGMAYVSYRMIRGSIWGDCLFACSGVIDILVLVFTLWRGSGSICTVVVGYCPPPTPASVVAQTSVTPSEVAQRGLVVLM